MALWSAFLLYGSVGGWSRTLFLLAHELPQEIGDFGILVRSGFSVSAAQSFNFLSALGALAGTALVSMSYSLRVEGEGVASPKKTSDETSSQPPATEKKIEKKI